VILRKTLHHNWNPTTKTTSSEWTTESAPTDSKKLRGGYANLRKQLHFLEAKEYDAVFDTVTELCTESEQLAFYAGVQLGTVLMMELLER